MAKQTIYITSAADLSIKNSQLQITFPDQETSFQRFIEDLGTLIIDHHSAHLTVPLLNRLAEQNVAVVFCNETHTPTTMLMDLESNCLQAKQSTLLRVRHIEVFRGPCHPGPRGQQRHQ